MNRPTNVDAIQPCLIEELAGLHVESHSDRVFVTNCIRRGPATVPAPEIDGNLLARYMNAAAVIVVAIITVTILIAVAIAILAIIL